MFWTTFAIMALGDSFVPYVSSSYFLLDNGDNLNNLSWFSLAIVVCGASSAKDNALLCLLFLYILSLIAPEACLLN